MPAIIKIMLQQVDILSIRANYRLIKIKEFFHHHKELLVILTLGIISRLLFLDNLPYRVDGDSARMAIDGLDAVKNQIPFFGTGWMANQNFVFYLYGFFLQIFGNTVFGMRFFSSIGGVLSIWAIYVLTKEMFNKKIALFASFFLTFLPMHIFFSRMGTDISYMTWFLPMTLCFLFKGAKDFKYRYFCYAGIFLGISQYFYQSARFMPIVVFFAFVILLTKETYKKLLIGLCIVFFLALLIYSPMVNYYLTHPGEFLSRMRQVSIFQSGFLQAEIQQGRGGQLLISHFVWPYFVFVGNVITSPIHYFQQRFVPIVGSLLFIIGLLFTFKQYRNPTYYLLHFWFFIGVILCGVFTIPALQASRYFIILPAVCIYMALAINFIFDYINKKYKIMVIMVILMLYGLSSVYSYIRYENYESYSYDINSQIASFAGRYLIKKSGNYQIYFMGDNMYYNAVPSLRFLTKKDGIDIPISQIITNTNFSKDSVFIVLPSGINKVSELRFLYKNNIYKEFKNPQGYTLFYFVETFTGKS